MYWFYCDCKEGTFVEIFKIQNGWCHHNSITTLRKTSQTRKVQKVKFHKFQQKLAQTMHNAHTIVLEFVSKFKSGGAREMVLILILLI